MKTCSRKILIVEFFSRGGLLHYSLQLARHFVEEAAADVETVLVTAREPEAAAPAGVRMRTSLSTWNPHRAPRHLPRRLVRLGRALRYAWVWGQIVRVVREEQPALVLLSDLEHRCDGWFVRRLHRWCQRQSPPAALADIWHNVEAFARSRSLAGAAPGAGHLLRQLPWRVRMAGAFDAIFVHGATLQRQFRELGGGEAHAIPHGNQVWFAEQAGPDPDLDRRFQLPAGALLALLFGSLNPYKGVGVLLAALRRLPPRQRPMVLIAGMPTAGSDLEGWHRYMQKEGLEPWVRWDCRYIPTPEIAWYFRRADWVVLPYLAASQSGVGHLALTFGKPLLVTATGGLAELIDGNGLVVPANDRVALARGMETMVTRPQQRARWGQRSAVLAARRHAWGPIARTVLEAAAPSLLRQAEGVGPNAESSPQNRSGAARIPTPVRAHERVRTPRV